MEEGPSRKLAVILHAEVVGSTTLVQANETVAHERIRDTFQQFSARGGTAQEIRGDVLVAEFARAFGWSTSRAGAMDELGSAIRESLADSRPNLIELPSNDLFCVGLG